MPRDRTRLLNALFRDAPEAIIIADADRQIVDVNAAFSQEFGYVLEDVIGQPTSVLYADQAAFHQSGDDVFRRDDGVAQVSSLYFRYRRQDGTIFPARTKGIRLSDDDGTVVGFVAMIGNLTQLVEKAKAGAPEEAVEIGASERALVNALFDKTPGMLHTCDPDGIIHRVNKAWLDRMGYRAEEVIGRCVWDLMTPEDAERSRTGIYEIWTTGGRRRVPYNYVAKSGELVEVELSATLDTSDNRQMALVLLEDVTERNRSMRALEERNGQLREFARMAAHDLQAPLRHISLFTEMILEETAAGNAKEAGDHAQDLQTCTARLGAMVKGLLEFSLANEAEVQAQDCDLRRIVDRACKTLGHDITSSGAQIDIGPMPAAHCDEGLMERVIENLVSNALKYVHPGVPPRITIEASKIAGSVDIVIQDNGIGIAPQFRTRIFEPMKRLHGSDSGYEGSGIGLALCKRIVSAHGGDIWVEGAGEGSRFRIRLPGGGLDVHAASHVMVSTATGEHA